MNNPPAQVDYPSLLKRSYVSLQKLQSRLGVLERSKTEPLAIIGLGCRFPGGGVDPEGFWRLLREGIDAVSEVPANRWDVESFYDPSPGTPGKIGRAHV